MIEVTPVETGRQTRREALVTFRNIGLAAIAAVGATSGLSWLSPGPGIDQLPGRQYYVAQGSYTGDYLNLCSRLLPGWLSELSAASGRHVTGIPPSPHASRLMGRLAQLPVTTSLADLERKADTHNSHISYSLGIAAYRDEYTGIVYDAFMPLLAPMPAESSGRLARAVTESRFAKVSIDFALDQSGNRLAVCGVS